MPVSITRHNPNFGTAPQFSPEDMQEIAEQGFKSVINNRPDGEGGASQPTSAQMEKAAHAAGLQYSYLPVISGQITEAQTAEFAALLASQPGPILAFCRSGARSTNLFQMASALS